MSDSELSLMQDYRSTKNPDCIAICTVGEIFGGVERHVLGIMTELATQGVSTLLILFYDRELAAQARAQGIEPIILPSRNRYLMTTSRLLARTLKQRKVNIVHVHGYKATVFCALARRWHFFAMVKTVHGLPEPMIGNPFRMWLDRLYSLSENLATRISHATECYVTEDLRMQSRPSHSDQITFVVPNGVENMDRYQFSRPPEFCKDSFNLLIVGRLDVVKGHHVAIEAIATGEPLNNAHLYFLGVGPRESELQALAASLGVPSRLHMLGFRRNVYDYIAHCNVLLIPSLHEGLPYTLLEAMALGTPIVASAVGGLAEVLQDGFTALLVPPLDASKLAQTIAVLHNDQETCAQLGEQAQRVQRAKYSRNTMTEKYLEIYRMLISQCY